MGYSGVAEVALNKTVSILGRYDYFDSDTDTNNDAHNRVIGGINYKISNTLLSQFNYQRKMYEDDQLDDSDKVMVQFKYSY